MARRVRALARERQIDWSFPRHLHLYLMLKSMEADGAYVCRIGR